MVSILYVDDERDLLELCKIFLEQTPDFSVEIAASAQEALAFLEVNPCDAIVSDYQMPEMDGIAFLKVVREKYGTIPFILFTGRGREEVVIDAINNGADFYLQKGGDVKAQFAELSHKIRQATARRQAEISLIESEKRLADIIDFLPDATFAINREGVVIAWNRAIEEMTGLSAEAMIGKGDHEYAIPFYGERRPILIDLIFASDAEIAHHYSKIFHRDTTITAETSLPHPKGSRIAVLAKAGPLCNRQGELVGAIEAIRDITERNKADDELRAAYEQIMASDEELRGQFDELAKNEQRVKENASRLEFMLGFYERAAEDETALIDYAVDGAGIVTNSPLGYLAFLNDDESELALYVCSKNAMEECSLRCKPVRYKTVTAGLWSEAVRQRRAVITNNYAAPDPAKKCFPEGLPVIIRHMSVPVIDEGRVVMVAGVANKLRDYTDDDAKELTLLMQGLWQVIRQLRTRQELRESEEKHRAIVENIQDVYYRADVGGNLIMASPSILPLFGYDSMEEILGKNLARDLWAYPEQRQAFLDTIGKEGEVKNYEIIIRRSDGKLLTVASSSHSYYDPHGEILGIEGIFHDVTPALEADQQARFLAGIMDITPASITVHAGDGHFLYANQRTFEMHGYSRDEFMALNLSQLDVPASAELIRERIEELRKNGEASFDVEHFKKDGSRIPLHVTITEIRWNSHNAILSIAIDLFERMEAEEILLESKEQLQLALAGADLGTWNWNIETGVVAYNERWAGMLGYTLDEIEPDVKSWKRLVHPDDVPRMQKSLDDHFEGRTESYELEHRLLHKNGSWVWVLTKGRVIRRDEAGRPLLAAGTHLDITERKRGEDALRDSEERYRSVLENIQDAFVRTDEEGHIVMASPSAAMMLGYDSPEDILGMPISSFYQHPDIRAGLLEKIKKQGKLVGHAIEFRQKNGSLFWGSVNAHFAYNAAGEPDGVECLIHDITEYRAMERAAHEANHKLNLMSSITRHDVANQITVLQGYAQIAAQKKGDPVIADYLKKILTAADTIAHQIEFTRTYQDVGLQEASWIHVEKVMDQVTSRVPIRFSKTCGGVEVFADPMLERVFFNLVENAARHGNGVTTITIRCEREPDGLLLIVEDDGKGIPLEEKEKIFQRGFGKNTGLGLFLVREILSITGITIKETGIPGKGARFEMLVPENSFRSTGETGR